MKNNDKNSFNFFLSDASGLFVIHSRYFFTHFNRTVLFFFSFLVLFASCSIGYTAPSLPAKIQNKLNYFQSAVQSGEFNQLRSALLRPGYAYRIVKCVITPSGTEAGRICDRRGRQLRSEYLPLCCRCLEETQDITNF